MLWNYAKSTKTPYSSEGQEGHSSSQCWDTSTINRPTLHERLRYHADRILPKLALPLALLAGGAITAGTTYALIKRVQNLIATATVSSDPTVWMQQARTQAYDPCYLGCDDCDDPSYAYNACARTQQVNVSGVICDGNRMWNWRDRYPLECLQAVGELYRLDALAALRQSYRNQLAIIILTVLGGLVGGTIVYKLWKWGMASRKARAEAVRERAKTWPALWEFRRTKAAIKTKGAEEGEEKHAQSGKVGGRRRGHLRLAGLLALFHVGRALSYACTGYDPSYDQYFVNENRSIFGVVHGWFSDCYDVEYCTEDCTTSCSGGSAGACSESCSEDCWTATYSDKAPEAYVNDTLPKVQACGFQLADAVEGDVNVRVANAGIEQNWWVRIGVNGYNVTNLNYTDEMIWCLHDIGDESPS